MPTPDKKSVLMTIGACAAFGVAAVLALWFSGGQARTVDYVLVFGMAMGAAAVAYRLIRWRRRRA